MIEFFTDAASTGSTLSEGLRHDITYTEMVSTGNLNLISDLELRSKLNQYYRQMNLLFERKSLITTDIWTKYRQLTGANSGGLRVRGQLPTGASADRLIEELKTNETILLDLRLLQANLSNFVGAGGYPALIENARSLLADIQGTNP